MRVIEAPNKVILEKNDITCFLAGGICNCPDWQKEVIEELDRYNLPNLVILNPRRANFDIKKDDSVQQIKWEFEQLNSMDIFSMYFANSEKSVQPICMYELGRHLALMPHKFIKNWQDRIVLGVEEGYSRENDVRIQTSLAIGLNNMNFCNFSVTPELHARAIYLSYNKIMENREHADKVNR